MGKASIRIKKELKDHVANRLQAAIAQECLYLLQSDVASLPDLDTALSQGPGIKMGTFGQCVIIELGDGNGGVKHMIEHLGPHFLDWADDLGRVESITPELFDKVVKGL